MGECGGGAYPVQWNMLVSLPFALMSCAIVSLVVFLFFGAQSFYGMPFGYWILEFFCISYFVCFIVSFCFWR